MSALTPAQDSMVYHLAAEMMFDAATDADTARIDRALDLVAQVERTANPRLFLVVSQSDPECSYHVWDGFCNCSDTPRERGARHCKHEYAVQLFNRLERAEADAEQAAPCICQPAHGIQCAAHGNQAARAAEQADPAVSFDCTQGHHEYCFWHGDPQARQHCRCHCHPAPVPTVRTDPDDSILDPWAVWPTTDGEPCEMPPPVQVGTITRLPLPPALQAISDELFGVEV